MGPSFLPPPVFHYQVKVHFFSESEQSFTEQPMKISLFGTLGEKEDISFVLYVRVTSRLLLTKGLAFMLPAC